MANQGLPLEVVLEWHLTGNHYPPLPVALIPVCIQAIKNANEGNWDDWIIFPPGHGFVAGETTARIVEACHLESFLNQDEEG
jgi:hypothetical protein